MLSNIIVKNPVHREVRCKQVEVQKIATHSLDAVNYLDNF